MAKGNPIITGYLFLYNVAMFAGWTYIAYLMVEHYAIEKASPETFWPKAEFAVKIFQTGAILEIIHAMLGFVRSPVVTTFMQVFSRVMLVWGIVVSAPPMQGHWVVSTMIGSWALVEMIRYSFYALNLIGLSPYPLLWLRYTAFTVLYPTGILSEIGCILLALPYLREANLYSLSMPNQLNIAFNYFYYVLLYLGTYIPGAPTMFGHMLTQRKKALGGGAAKKPKSE
eukprot:GEZU01036691.1.p1 GENE.GEZU01036691.1~~GEZU01036691.1.p1  ORF type:complete len:227 (-),score=64.00 GEZU01036691.1:80-760(-)